MKKTLILCLIQKVKGTCSSSVIELHCCDQCNVVLLYRNVNMIIADRC